jgi:hypothetical protein
MAEVPDLTAAGTLTGAELVHLVQAGNSRKATLATLLALTHAHTIANVTGLQAALDAKLDDSQAGSTGLAVLAATNTATLQALVDLEIGVDVQAFSAALALYSAISPSANVQSLLGAANYAAIRTLLSLAPGVDVQAYDAELAALAGLTSAANKLPYFTGSGTAALADLSAFARTILDDADAATVRATIGAAASGAIGSLDGAKVRKSANLTAQDLTAEAVVTWNTEDWDTGSYHDTGSNTDRMTVTNAGYYEAKGQIVLTNLLAGQWVLCRIQRYNSSNVVQETVCGMISSNPAVTTIRVNCSGECNMAAGDYVKLSAQVQSDTSADISTDSWLSIRRIG